MIWAGFEVTFKNRWSSRFDSEKSVEEWSRVWAYALADLGLADVRRGLAEAAKRCEWPPSSPAEFRKLIGSEIPTLDEAVSIICRQGGRPDGVTFADWWQHPICLAVATDERIDVFNLRRLPAAAAKRAVQPIYDRHVAMAAAGRVYAFPADAVEIAPRAKQSPSSDELEAARQAFLEFQARGRELFGIKKAKE